MRSGSQDPGRSGSRHARQVEAKKPLDTLGDVETKPLVHTFVARQADVEGAIFEDKMGVVEVEAMVYTLPHTLAEEKSKTLGHKRTDEKGEEVVN